MPRKWKSLRPATTKKVRSPREHFLTRDLRDSDALAVSYLVLRSSFHFTSTAHATKLFRSHRLLQSVELALRTFLWIPIDIGNSDRHRESLEGLFLDHQSRSTANLPTSVFVPEKEIFILVWDTMQIGFRTYSSLSNFGFVVWWYRGFILKLYFPTWAGNTTESLLAFTWSINLKFKAGQSLRPAPRGSTNSVVASIWGGTTSDDPFSSKSSLGLKLKLSFLLFHSKWKITL